MEVYFNILLERARMVREWRRYMSRIADSIKKILPDARIYIFGSVIRGEAVGGSDVDILVVSKNMPESNIERAKLKRKIEELSNLPMHHPFELHLASEEEAEWYFTRVKEMIGYK